MAETASYIVWVNTEKKIASFVEEKGFDKMEFQDHNYFMDYLIDLSDKWFKFKCCRRASLSENRRRCVSEAAEVIWRKQNRVKEWP